MSCFAHPILGVLERDFNLKSNHIAILREISTAGLSADEISAKTGIPKGRIYDFLNELIDMRLLLKQNNVPVRYHVDNAKNRIAEFLKIKSEELSLKQERLKTLLLEHEGGSVFYIKQNLDYISELKKSLREDNEFQLVCPSNVVPLGFFYPLSDTEYLKFRSVLIKKRLTMAGAGRDVLSVAHAYRDAIMKGKPIKCFVWKEALNFHFKLYKKTMGQSALKKLFGEIKKWHSEYKVETHITTRPFPYYLFVSDRRIISFVIFAGTISGLSIQNAEAVETHKQLINSLAHQTKPLEQYLRRWKR